MKPRREAARPASEESPPPGEGKYSFPLILSLSKDATPKETWFDKLTMSGKHLTAESTRSNAAPAGQNRDSLRYYPIPRP